MASWAKPDDIIDKGFGGSRNGRAIEGAVFHHVAGTNGQAYVANANSRDSHPTYHVKNSGYLTGIVHPNRRPYSTGHSVDSVAITFEIDNQSTGGDWPVSAAALSRAIDVCVFHAREQGLKKFAKNTPGRDQPNVFFIAWHNQYVNTNCPGPHIMARLDWIVQECQRRLDGSKPTPTPTPQPTPETTTWERAPGGERNAPMWPRGPLMARIQRALKNRTKFGEKSRYDGPDDGVGGSNTAIGIQRTLNISRLNGVSPYVQTVEDGKLGLNNGYGVQHYGRAHGKYRGDIDGDPRIASWTAFAVGLEAP